MNIPLLWIWHSKDGRPDYITPIILVLSGVLTVYLTFRIIYIFTHCNNEEDRKRRFAKILLHLTFIYLSASFFVTSLIPPSFLRGRAQGQFTKCQSNEKTIAKALEMYGTDHQGKYPSDLDQLTPNYIKDIPTCEAVGTDSYSANYQVSLDGKNYTFFCGGDNHTQLTDSDYPQYNSRQGLVTRP